MNPTEVVMDAILHFLRWQEWGFPNNGGLVLLWGRGCDFNPYKRSVDPRKDNIGWPATLMFRRSGVNLGPLKHQSISILPELI